MGTLREAIFHVRNGKAVRCGEKIIRMLTQDETDAYFLEHSPSRRVVRDEAGAPTDVEEYGSGRTEQLGIWCFEGDVRKPFEPTNGDIYLPVELDERGEEKPRQLRTDWEIVLPPEPDPEPEVIPPETVDEVLTEEDTSSSIEE